MTEQPDRPALGHRTLMGLPALLWAGAGHAAGLDEPERGGALTCSVAAEPPTYRLAATSSFAVTHRLSDEQARTVHPAAGKALVRRSGARALDAAYAIPLPWWQRIVAIDKAARGWSMSPTHMIHQDLSDVWLAG